MSNLTQIQQQGTAGPIAIAFDYQFYYFICLALEMQTGDTIGFEVKDDIHIQKSNGKVILLQVKHTILKDGQGNQANLTKLDSDLWKSLSNWTDMIKSDPTILTNHYFCLATNKGGRNNQFIDALELFKADGNVDEMKKKIEELRVATKDNEIIKYIKKVQTLGKKQSERFFTNLKIETEINNIIDRIKKTLFERYYDNGIVEEIYKSLFSNMSADKYLDIKDRKKFEISLADFSRRYGKCFQQGWNKEKLPRRQIQMTFPVKLEEQIFIKQLIDLGELDANSNNIVGYTTQMLEASNQLLDWINNYDILTTDLNMFKDDSFLLWDNEFKSKYRSIKSKIKAGESIENLEMEIKALAFDLLDHMKRQTVSIDGENLGVKFSNGYYYSLANEPKIGWHFDWEKKYKPS